MFSFTAWELDCGAASCRTMVPPSSTFTRLLFSAYNYKVQPHLRSIVYIYRLRFNLHIEHTYIIMIYVLSLSSYLRVYTIYICRDYRTSVDGAYSVQYSVPVWRRYPVTFAL